MTMATTILRRSHVPQLTIEMNPVAALTPYAWAYGALDDAIQGLAQKRNFISAAQTNGAERPLALEETYSPDTIEKQVETLTDWIGVEAEPVHTTYADFTTFLRHGGPAILMLPIINENNQPYFLALLSGGKKNVSILTPSLSVVRLEHQLIQAAICYDLEAPLLPETNQLLSTLDIPEHRRLKARQAIFLEKLGHLTIHNSWLIKLSPRSKFSVPIREARLPLLFILTVIGQAGDYILYLAAWGVIGQVALTGQITWAWLLAGLLLWISSYPFTLLRIWGQRLFSVRLGKVLKERFFYGILQLDLDEIQKAGEGKFLAWSMESDKLEQASLGGGFLVLGSTVSLLALIAALTISQQFLMAGLLLVWLLFSLFIIWRFSETFFKLNSHYSAMTNDFLERIDGHRTRLVQETKWFDDSDRDIVRYIELTKRDDANTTLLLVFIPHGWVIAGLLATAVTFISTPTAVLDLGINFFAILFAYQLLEILTWGTTDVIRAIVAWRVISPIYKAVDKREGLIAQAPPLNGAEKGQSIVSAHNLIFGYKSQNRDVLRGVDLQIFAEDQILLEGPSGGGKSTLASILAGLYISKSGLLLLRGFDRPTLGTKSWHQRIIAAPQFHENHVLNASFAFNLLMGRQWPPSEEDLKDAEAICAELGLGDLLARMPRGLYEPVGDEGWMLSHGERSRLYIARALLQRADLVILDESFASLDPENMRTALETVMKHAPTLMVIAHP